MATPDFYRAKTGVVVSALPGVFGVVISGVTKGSVIGIACLAIGIIASVALFIRFWRNF